jgi:hypothetical protein
MKSDHASKLAHASEFWRSPPNKEEFHYLALHTDAPAKSQKEHEAAGLAGYARKKIQRTPGQGWRLGPREVSNLFPLIWEPLEAVGETVTVTHLSIGRRDGRVVHTIALAEPRTLEPGKVLPPAIRCRRRSASRMPASTPAPPPGHRARAGSSWGPRGRKSPELCLWPARWSARIAGRMMSSMRRTWAGMTSGAHLCLARRNRAGQRDVVFFRRHIRQACGLRHPMTEPDRRNGGHSDPA